MKKSNKSFKKNLVCSLLLIAFSFTSSGITGQDFYKDLLERSRQEYLKGEYSKAVANLKIVEFGIKDDPALLKTVYFYFLASYFKLYKMAEVKSMLEKFKNKFKVETFSGTDFPEDVRSDLTILNIFIRKNILDSKMVEKRILYETLFYKTFTNINEMSGEDLKLAYDQLTRINKADQRKSLLLAVVDFRAEKYKKVLKKVNSVLNLKIINLQEIKDEVYYLLAVSYFFLDDQEKSLMTLQKIENEDKVKKFENLLAEYKKS